MFSVAAPTAGLHFTQDILKKLADKGVEIGYVTLNVGIGTFRPVKCENVLDHKMDSESFEISQETADLINRAKAEGCSRYDNCQNIGNRIQTIWRNKGLQKRIRTIYLSSV